MSTTDECARPTRGVEQWRVLLAAVAWPLVTGYAAIAAVFAVVVALAPEAPFSPVGVLLAAAPGWLAAWQVPISIGDHHLGLLPLSVTIGMCVLVARAAWGVADRLGFREPQQAVPVIGVMAASHGGLGAAIAIAAYRSPVTADPLVAFAVPAVLAAASAAIGLSRRCGMIAAASPYLDPAAVAGLRAAALGLAGLVASSAVVVTVASAVSVPTMYALFEGGPDGFGSASGLFGLSVLYLFNAVVAGLAFLVGPGFSIGAVSASPTGFSGGAVPGLPLLAGLPESHAAWWPALFALPFAVGVVVGWSVRRSSPSPAQRVRSVLIAGTLIGFSGVVLGVMAGGRLGSGPFAGVVVPVGLVSVAAFGWIVIPGALVAWLAGERPRRVKPEQEDVAEADDEPADADEREVADEIDEDTEEAHPADEAEGEAEDSDDLEDPEVDPPEPEEDSDEAATDSVGPDGSGDAPGDDKTEESEPAARD